MSMVFSMDVVWGKGFKAMQYLQETRKKSCVLTMLLNWGSNGKEWKSVIKDTFLYGRAAYPGLPLPQPYGHRGRVSQDHLCVLLPERLRLCGDGKGWEPYFLCGAGFGSAWTAEEGIGGDG